MAVNRIELEEYKMKKLIAMLLTLAMVLSLAACGAQSTPTQAATEAPARCRDEGSRRDRGFRCQGDQGRHRRSRRYSRLGCRCCLLR